MKDNLYNELKGIKITQFPDGLVIWGFVFWVCLFEVFWKGEGLGAF